METIPNLTSPRAIEQLTFWRDTHEKQFKCFPKMTPARKPRFEYQNLPDTERLCYELFNWDNFHQMLDLFQNDPNPFVSDEFKSLNQLEVYTVAQLEYSRYSFKRGACDWFIKLKTTHELVGVLHIYDLNWELYDGKHPACMVGYAIGEEFRKQGYAYEATKHLLNQIPIIFKRYEVMAEPKIDNEASYNLLKKLGFKEKRKFRDDKSTLFYKKMVNKIPLKTCEQVIEEEAKYR